MAWLVNAWRTASRNQKITIVIAVLVAIGSALTPAPLGAAAPGATLTEGISSGIASEVAVAPSAGPPTSPTSVGATPSPGPTTAPTPAATPGPTPKPTPKPTPAPSLTLTFTSLTSPVNPGSFATATVKTSGGAYCSIVVEYKSGPSTASGLGPKYASSSGVAWWTWKVGTRTTAGSWPVTVTCSKSGLHKSVTKYLEVL